MAKVKVRLDMHNARLFELDDGRVVYVLKDKCDVAGFAKNPGVSLIRKWLRDLKTVSNVHPNLYREVTNNG